MAHNTQADLHLNFLKMRGVRLLRWDFGHCRLFRGNTTNAEIGKMGALEMWGLYPYELEMNADEYSAGYCEVI